MAEEGAAQTAEIKTEEEIPDNNESKKIKVDAKPNNEAFKKPLIIKKSKAETPGDDSDSSKPSEDVTLILSAEEEAEVAAETNEDAVKTEPKKEIKTKKSTQKNVWISNISTTTKAADLKKLFSEKFKVESAKIVTNGKSFFGYICLETAEQAEKSVKELNQTVLANKKITVSLNRPDIRGSRQQISDNRRVKEPSKKPIRVTNGVKKPDQDKKGEEKKKEADGGKDAKPDDETKKPEDDPEEKLKQLRRRDARNVRIIQELRTDLKRANTELQNNRRRLTEANRRLDAERDRKSTMRRDIETLEAELKAERRRFQLDLEQMEKKKKMDEIRYQEDRSMLNRELDECRKLREFLQRKIDDLGMSRHSRSSPHRSGSMRSADKMPRARMESRAGRSPPPPPKINSRRSPRDRSPPSYKGGSSSGSKKARIEESSSSKHLYGNSHYSGSSSFSGSSSKPLLGHYPSSGSSGGPPRDMSYGSTAYPEQHRYVSSGFPPGGYSISGGSANPVPLMSRPMGYPDVRSGQRKY